MQHVLDKVSHNQWSGISNDINKFLPQELADLISSIHDEKKQLRFFKLLPAQQKVAVFPHLEEPFQETLVEELPTKIIKYILRHLEPDDRTDILEEVNQELLLKLLRLLPGDELKEAQKLLSYPEESIGRLMTPEYIALSPNTTIKKALDSIRRIGQDKETITYVYIVDSNNHLLDDIRLRKLILTDPKKKIKEIMDYNFISLNAYDDREEAVRTMQKYDRNALPVIDKGVLVGIVTFDDIFDVAEEEATEDIQKQSGVSPFEINYSSASIFEIYKKRVGWLLLLLFGSFISSSIIAHFSFALESVIALSFFIAVLIGAGGNVGTQSSALIIRALAVGDIQLTQWSKIVFKELFLGIMLGVSLGLAMYLRAYWMKGARQVSYVVGAAIFFVVLWANLIGALLPLILKRLKVDPAIVSSPLITTIIDSTGLFIYFNIARLFITF